MREDEASRKWREEGKTTKGPGERKTRLALKKEALQRKRLKKCRITKTDLEEGSRVEAEEDELCSEGKKKKTSLEDNQGFSLLVWMVNSLSSPSSRPHTQAGILTAKWANRK